MVCLSCLSVTFVHCAQTAQYVDTIFLAYDRTISLPDGVEICLTSVNPFLLKFGPKVTHHPMLTRASETFGRQIAAEWLERAQWSQLTMEFLKEFRKPTSLFRMVPSLTLYDLLLPKLRVLMHMSDIAFGQKYFCPCLF